MSDRSGSSDQDEAAVSVTIGLMMTLSRSGASTYRLSNGVPRKKTETVPPRRHRQTERVVASQKVSVGFVWQGGPQHHLSRSVLRRKSNPRASDGKQGRGLKQERDDLTTDAQGHGEERMRMVLNSGADCSRGDNSFQRKRLRSRLKSAHLFRLVALVN